MKWRIELNSVIEFETEDGFSEEDAVAHFFEEMTYPGEPTQHDYSIEEVKENA